MEESENCNAQPITTQHPTRIKIFPAHCLVSCVCAYNPLLDFRVPCVFQIGDPCVATGSALQPLRGWLEGRMLLKGGTPMSLLTSSHNADQADAFCVSARGDALNSKGMCVHQIDLWPTKRHEDSECVCDSFDFADLAFLSGKREWIYLRCIVHSNRVDNSLRCVYKPCLLHDTF